ncbi:MAG: hypothetical protein NZ581_00010 [Candidatus Caldarchaeum sp.]|nr:hypothetical protein [Candidatus Caldarchaeum sp.]MDW8434572.1 hypothetical protein [Candidatus Caldarchaeum sp.]
MTYGEPLFEEKMFFFPRYRVAVYWDSLVVSHWPYQFVIPLSDVVDVKVVEKIPWYVGYGFEALPFGRVVYFRFRPGHWVEVEKSSGFWRKLVLTVKDVDRFLEIINRQRPFRQRF